MMQLAIVQSALSSFGTLMVGYAAIKIHFRIMHEHAIDPAVEQEMQREQKIAIVGVFLIILGFLIDIYLLTIA